MKIFAGMVAAEDIDPARSVSWLWPEQAELIYGSIASLLIFGLLWKFAGPAIKQAMADRTTRIQQELDESAAAKAEAEAEATGIRRAAGDIDAERQRLFAEADTQAEALLADGRARLEAGDRGARGARPGRRRRRRRSRQRRTASRDRPHGERRIRTSPGWSGRSTTSVQQELIEHFIARVGASS